MGFFDFFITAPFNDYLYVTLKPWVSYYAMKAHYSQFVWYRKLFVVFSRYTFLNHLRVMNPPETLIEKPNEEVP